MRFVLLMKLALLAVLVTGCTPSLFKVKPVAQLSPFPVDSKSVDGGNVTVRVGPLLTDEQSHNLFEVNLPLSGILAFRTELAFKSGAPVNLKKLRFKVRDNQGHDWTLLTSKKAVSRILKFNEITLYNPNSKKQFSQEFGSYALDYTGQLSESQPRQSGFLFFQSPQHRPVDTSQPFNFSVERLAQPVTIVVVR